MDDFFKKPFTLDRIARIFFIVALIVLLIYLVGGIWRMLVPFAVAWITAVMLMPAVKFFQHKVKIKNRIAAIFVVLLLFIIIVTGVIALLLPSIVAEGRKAWELFSYYFTPDLLLSFVPEQYRADVANTLNLDYLFSQFDFQEILHYIQSLFERGWSILSSTITFFLSFAVVGIFLLYTFFILKDYEKINRGVIHLFPESARPYVLELGANINKYVTNYFKGQGLIALICGVFLAIGFWLMGMPLGITCGLFIGFLNLVPYMQIFGMPPMILLCMLQSASTGQNVWILLLIAFGILGLSQLLQDAYLTPTILGHKMGMLPAVLLLSLTVWGSLLGFWGLIFALPLTMILYTFYMKYVIKEPLAEEEPLHKPNISELTERIKINLPNKKHDDE